MLVISADYKASPEMKRVAYHASYRADPEEKRAASRVASHTSCLHARISWFMTETDSTLFTTLRLQQLTPSVTKITPQKMAETSHIKNISHNVATSM